MHNPESIDPADLKIHPLLSKLPEWDKDDPSYHAHIEGIRARGIITPIVCVRPNLIVVGVGTWRAARTLQLAEVPVRWDDTGMPAHIILASLCERQHLGKGAVAYLAVPLLVEAIKESVPKRLKNLQKPQQNPESPLSRLQANTAEELAHDLGISRALLFQAHEVRKLFENGIKYRWEESEAELSLKEYFEPRILAAWEEKPLGLGAVIAGCGAKISPNVLNQREQKQLELFTEGVGMLVNRFTYWQKFDADSRKQAMKDIREDLRELSFEHCREMAAWFSDMARTLRREAKAKKAKPAKDKAA